MYIRIRERGALLVENGRFRLDVRSLVAFASLRMPCLALRSDYIYDTNMQSTCTLHVHIHTCIRTDIVAQVCAAAARAVARAALSSCLAYSNVSGACARKQRDAANQVLLHACLSCVCVHAHTHALHMDER